MAVLLAPVLFVVRAWAPTAVFINHVVLNLKDSEPIAVFWSPVVLVLRAPLPTTVLSVKLDNQSQTLTPFTPRRIDANPLEPQEMA
jgi:hypothetical protein